jgi:hypothetical protein
VVLPKLIPLLTGVVVALHVDASAKGEVITVGHSRAVKTVNVAPVLGATGEQVAAATWFDQDALAVASQYLHWVVLPVLVPEATGVVVGVHDAVASAKTDLITVGHSRAVRLVKSVAAGEQEATGTWLDQDALAVVSQYLH